MKLDASDPCARRATDRGLVPGGSRWLDALAVRARENPGGSAIAEIGARGRPERTVSNAELVTLCAARARTLRRVLPSGGTLLAALPSGIDLASWIAASVGAGVRLVLMHPNCGPQELRSVARKTGAGIILSRDHGVAGESWMDDDPAEAGGMALRRADLMAPGCEPGSIVLGSSGTTGLPRLVLRESAALDADAAGVAHGMGLTADDSVLCVPPLCHSYGVDILLGAMYSGAALYIMAEFDAAGVAAQIGSGVSVLPGLPFLYEALLRMDPTPCSRLRLALSAGSDLSSSIREAFGARWGVQIGQLYGATELGTVAVHRPDHAGFDPQSIGAPLPGVSFRIVDAQSSGRLLAPGEVGQLAVRAPSMLSSYLDGEAPLADGHFLTGDLARIDSHGRAMITGRLKFLIDIGGFKVNPLEVEGVLREHPMVADCAVAPVSLSDTIRRIRAFVVPSDPASPPSERELRSFLKARLSANKVPRTFEMVASLPRSPLGKLLRRQLHGDSC